MRCRILLRVALLAALACSVAAGLCARARADVQCAVEVRHFPAAGTEAPGTYAISLVAGSPRSVAAEWEAYTDRGFLRAPLPVVQLAASDAGRSSILSGAHSRTIVIRLPEGTHVYESWLRTVGADVCAPPAGDPIRGSRFKGSVRETISTPDPADAPIAAIVAPELERMDCPHPFVDAHPVALEPVQYPPGETGSGVSLVRVLIGPDGRVVRASVYRSSGNVRFDDEALGAVARSTFTAPVAFCRPTFGAYVFHATFP